MTSGNSIYKKLDWRLILSFLILIIIGWFNVFSSIYDPELQTSFSLSSRYGMQLIWIVIALITAAVILFVLNPNIYSYLSRPFYIFSILLLLVVIFAGTEVNGSKSWLELGSFRFQPAEISKIATSVALAAIMSGHNFKFKSSRGILSVAITILLPMLLIILEKETGSALIYVGFSFMLFREGLNGWIIIAGLFAIMLFLVTLSFSVPVAIIILFGIMMMSWGAFSGNLLRALLLLAIVLPLLIFFPHQEANIQLSAESIERSKLIWVLAIISVVVIYALYKFLKNRSAIIKNSLFCFGLGLLLIFSVEFFFENILQDHQRARIENLLGIKEDLLGAGYNVHQSKIAIGSGGLLGKGFLKGTQTKFNFVPEQSTDFIFCTIGEEWGFLGSLFLIGLFSYMIIRIIILSERQRSNFTRIYGYCLASVLFMHFVINTGMTIGLMPVIGIPLPFISYGGSSLLAFTIFFFIFIRLDLERWR